MRKKIANDVKERMKKIAMVRDISSVGILIWCFNKTAVNFLEFFIFLNSCDFILLPKNQKVRLMS